MKFFEEPVIEIMAFRVDDVVTFLFSIGDHDNAFGDAGGFV